MRKIFTIIISLILCVAVFAACGSFRNNEDSISESKNESVESIESSSNAESVESSETSENSQSSEKSESSGDVESSESTESSNNVEISLNYGDYTGNISVYGLKVPKSGTLSELPEINGYHWEYNDKKITNGTRYVFDTDVVFYLKNGDYIMTLNYGDEWLGDKSVKRVFVVRNGVISGLPKFEGYYWSYCDESVEKSNPVTIKNGDKFTYNTDIEISLASEWTGYY